MRSLLRRFFPFASLQGKKTLQGKNVDLSYVRRRDLPTFFALWESQVMREEAFLPLSEHLFYKKFEENGFWSEDFGVMLIFQKDGKFVGTIGFYKNALEALTLHYFLDKTFSEEAVLEMMKEAVFLFSSHLYSSKTTERLQVFVPDYQKLNITVAQRSGFSFEGIFRRALFKNGKYLDLCVYSLLRSEWEENYDKNSRSPLKTRRSGTCL